MDFESIALTTRPPRLGQVLAQLNVVTIIGLLIPYMYCESETTNPLGHQREHGRNAAMHFVLCSNWSRALLGYYEYV